MVLTTIADITFELTIWGIRKVFNIGYWAIYGSPKSETVLLLELQNKIWNYYMKI